MLRVRFVAIFPLLLTTTACGAMFGIPSAADYQAQAEKAQADARQASDAAFLKQVDDSIAKAEAGGARESVGAAVTLESAYAIGAVARGVVPADRAQTVLSLIDRDAERTPGEKPMLLAARGRLEVAMGDEVAGEESLRAALAEKPTVAAFLALAPLLDEQQKHDEIIGFAKKTLAEVSTDDQRFEVLFGTILHTHASSPETGLAWASKQDVAFYREEKARRDAMAAQEREEHRRRREEESARMNAQFEESRGKSSCSSRCDADYSSCKSRCGTGGMCSAHCEDARRHCENAC